MKGKVPKIKLAPEPSTILWENVRYGKLECFIRRSLVTLAAVCCIAVSLVFTLASKYIQDSSASTNETSSVCPVNFHDLSTSEKRSLLKEDQGLTHCYCDAIPFYRRRNDGLCTSYFDLTIRNLFIGYAAVLVVVGLNASLGGILTRFANFEKHHTEELKMKSTFDRLFILKYINTSLVFLLSNNGTVLNSLNKFTGFDAVSTAEFSRGWYQNIGITLLLVQMGNVFGGHIVKFIQFITMKYRLWKARRDPSYAITQDELNKLHEGPPFRFAENYAQLMSTLYGCMTFNLGIPLLNWIGFVNCLLFYFIDKYFFVHVCSSPARLNIRLSKRVRSLIPGAIMINLVMALWTLSNDDVFQNTWSTEALNFSSLQKAHLRVDLVALVSSKLYQSHMFPILLLIISAIGLKLVILTVDKLRQSGLLRIIQNLFCIGGKVDEQVSSHTRRAHESMRSKNSCINRTISLVKKLVHEEDTSPLINIANTVSYPRAVQRNLIKGLATYNILHNPKYKEKFAITWKFAMRHRHVRSVILYDTVTDILTNEHEKDGDAKRTERLRRISAMPILTHKEIELKAEREKANKKMLKMVQNETRRRAGGMLGLSEDGNEDKEEGRGLEEGRRERGGVRRMLGGGRIPMARK